jgi:outer membrane protein assembly factor BamB
MDAASKRLRACAAAAVAAAAGAGALAGCGGQAAGLASPSVISAAAGNYPASASGAIPDGDWTQFNYDAQRSGVGPAITGITPSGLAHLRARVLQLPGTVDSSVIALHAVKVHGRTRDVLIMTTTYGRTLALDARTGARLWQYVPASIGSYQGSSQITTATPTADPTRLFVYAAAPDGRVRKLAISNGHQVWSRSVTFDPTHEKLASPPTISGNSLIVVTDGYFGDAQPYQGHVVTLDLATGRIQHVWNALCSARHRLIVPSSCAASDAAIWGRAGAVLEPGTGRILVSTGNAPFDGHTNWGDSVLELAPDASRLLHNWTPVDQQQLTSNDTDLGSTSPALLPDPGGPRLVVQGGKDGILKLLDLDRLDGTTGGAGPRTGGQLQSLSDPGGTEMFTAPVVWVHNGRTYLFVADGSGTTEYILHSGTRPRLSVGWQNGTSGTSPVLAGGLLYVYDESGGQLNLYEPTTGHRLDTLSAAAGHWNSPIAIAGRIVLPVGNANDRATRGTLYIWHLPGH